MKLFIKMLIFLLVLACAAPFFLKDQDGRPLMKADDLDFSGIAVPKVDMPISSPTDPVDDKERESATTTVFKWQDEEGVWHFSDAKKAGSETLVIKKNANLVHFEKPVEPEKPAEKQEQETAKNGKARKLDSEDSPYEQLPELINEAKNVKQLFEDRQKQQEQAINDLTR